MPPLLLSDTAEAITMESAPDLEYLSHTRIHDLLLLHDNPDSALPTSSTNNVATDVDVSPDNTTSDAMSLDGESDMDEDKHSRVADIGLSRTDTKGNTETPLSADENASSGNPARDKIIASLLTNGHRSLKRDRLMTPENDSAYRYFQQVIELAPGHKKAHNGMDRIAERYAILATRALNENDRYKAGLYVARGLQIRPNNEYLVALHDRIYSPPPPASIPAREESEGFITRMRKYLTQKPAEEVRQQTWSFEP
jgi:hypothetical protein